MRILMLMLVLLVVGCAEVPKAKEHPFDVQVELYKKAQEEQAKVTATMATTAASCTEDTCRMIISSQMALMSVAKSNGGGNQPPQYVPQKSLGREIVSGLVSMVPALGQIYLGIHQSDNSVKQSAQQYAWLTSAVQNMQPDVHIEGGYIGGSVTGNGAGIGNTFALSGDGNAIGDGNSITNGNWNNNSGRAFSPGPYTGFNGGNCTSTAGTGSPSGTPNGNGGTSGTGTSGDANCNGGG